MKKIIRSTIQILRGLFRKISHFIVLAQIQSVGKNFRCDQKVVIYGGENISVGNNVVFNRGVLLQSCEGAKIVVGNNVTLSYDVKVLTGNLSLDSVLKNNIHEHSSNSIHIGNNVWIGANSIVLPGVTIPDNTIIAAGTVVNKSLAAENCLYAGVPAKLIKSI